jgi:hypothetical protein
MSPDQVDAYLAAAEREIDGAGDGDSANDASGPGGDQDDAKSAVAGEEEDTGSEGTGGAVSDYQSLDPSATTAGTGSAQEQQEASNADATDQSGEDDQPSQAGGEAEATGGKGWRAKYEALKSEYDKLLGSFKASGRTVKVESPDDARRLMQMGYDYTNKMRDLKPHLRLIRALEHNDLLDPEKINFTIDLMKGNPEAIKKFLKDKEIDPIDLDLEDSADYTPTDHRPSEAQEALDDVLTTLREEEHFPRLAKVITKEWDTASQEVLMGTPRVIAILSDHMAKGYFDQIAAKVAYERSLGRLAGLSDLEAYKTVGDAMEAQGQFAPAGRTTTPNVESGQGPSQDSKGSGDGIDRRKKAASPTTGKPAKGASEPKNFLSDFTDEEIEAMGHP